MPFDFLSPSFLEVAASYSEAKAVLIGCPLDDTASFRPGSRFSPRTIRENSIALETYSPFLKNDISDFKIADMGDLNLPVGKKERALAIIAEAAHTILEDQKLFCAVGGEHLISLPLISESKKRYHNLKVIHLDAHADLRQEYQGESLSHATVIRRVLEIVGRDSLCQIGIRSGTREEFALIDELNSLYSWGDQERCGILNVLKEFPCYITLDLDIIDPGIFPATGTPEPGGHDVKQLLELLYSFKGLNIIGMDVVEYNPLFDLSGHCSIIVAKVIREMLLSYMT